MNWARYWEQWARAQGGDPQRQVARTRFGRPLEEADTQRVVNHLLDLLDLRPGDTLLDVCCGNGLLTRRLAAHCREVVGMDVAAAMIETARSSHSASNITYLCGPAEELDQLTDRIFDKMLIQFSFQYFERKNGAVLLENMSEKLAPGGLIVLGDVPDRALLRQFYRSWRSRRKYAWDRLWRRSEMGKFWSKKEIELLANRAGLLAAWLPQPEVLPYAHYRVDVVLKKLP